MKQFIEDNYTFERSLEDHSVSILNEIFEGLELGDTGNAAREDEENDDEDDNIIMIDDEDLGS